MPGDRDADGGLPRRRLLACLPAVAGMAGCTGLLGGDGGTTQSTTASSAGADTDTPSAPTATATATAIEDPGETATGVPSPTQTVAPRPPSDVIRMDEAETTLSVYREEYYTAFEASVLLDHVGSVPISRLAVRVDAVYDPPGARDPVAVANAYVDRNTFGEDREDPLFSPGTAVRMRLGRDDLRFRRDGTADGSTDVDRYSLAVVFRRVEYGRTPTPSPDG